MSPDISLGQGNEIQERVEVTQSFLALGSWVKGRAEPILSRLGLSEGSLEVGLRGEVFPLASFFQI